MKETGIIISGDHPKLILEGIKTMTRRVIKPQPVEWQISKDILGLGWKGFNLGSLSRDYRGSIAEKYLATLCPYGQVGDRLWVRETCKIMDFGNHKGVVLFKTTANPDPETEDVKWTPSIFMPRWASRITLEITEVRVERVQEITESDAIAEGVIYKTTNEFARMRVLSQGKANQDTWPTPQEAFAKLWDSLNAKRGYGWDTNPWVWVLSFKMVSQ